MLRSVLFPQGRTSFMNTGRSPVGTYCVRGKSWGHWEGLWTEEAMPAASRTTQTSSCLCTMWVFSFQCSFFWRSSSCLPRISSAPTYTSMPFPLQSLLPASTLLSKQFKLWASCLLICLSHLDKGFSRLYPSLSQALVIAPFLDSQPGAFQWDWSGLKGTSSLTA